jgi:betaine-aldehyde dehydrogenase
VNFHRRAELLLEVSRQVMAARPLVAEMLTREMGKPYKESFDEVAWSASAIDYYAADHDSAGRPGRRRFGVFPGQPPRHSRRPRGIPAKVNAR